MKINKWLFLPLCSLLLTACDLNNFTVTDKSKDSGGGSGANPGSSISFAGIDTIDNVSGVSARLNWTSTTGAQYYQVFNVTTGTPVWIANVTAPTALYTVTGLSPTNSYKFRVRLMDSQGLSDTNTNDKSVTTASVTATFNGWTHIKAVGPKAPAAQGSDLATAVASVTLTWPAVTPSSGSVASFNIYRATSTGGQNYNVPLASGIDATTRTYIDSTVVAGTTYYYTIAPVVAGSTVILSAAADLEAKVIVPKDNMVLLHRWAANKEMCDLMGRAVDRTNNYRCTVATGGNAPPATDGSGFVDLGQSIFIDAYEQGCNYTASNACTDATVSGGAASPCIGIRSTPNGNVTAAAGSIYYSRQSATCYINTSGTTGTSWTAANSATAAQRQAMGSAAPGLPPFALVSQTSSQDVCTGQGVSGFAGTKRLLKRREQLLVGAWDSSLNDTTVGTIENGTNLDTTHYCNTNYASPQGNTTTDISGSNPTIAYDNNVIPSAKDTLPACRFGDCASTASTVRSVRTGSSATSSCVSRYGAQDVVGNVWEWSSDQINCNGTTCSGQTGGSNTADSTNTDWAGLAFDDTQGPTKDPTHTTLNTAGTGYSITSWGYMQFPAGIPIAQQSSFSGDGVVSLTSTQFHGDYFWINVTSSARGAFAGGGWYAGASAGRFALSLHVGPANTYTFLGFRCALPAD